MTTKLTKAFVIVAILIAFIGQAFANAYAQPCGPDEHSSVYSEQVLTIDTEHQEQEDECCELDCCDSNCNCLGSACSAIHYLIPSHHPVTNFASTDNSYLATLEYPISTLSYLYRPPIIT